MRHASTLGLVLMVAGCSTQLLYDSARGWQRQECQKLQDRDERTRCEKSTARSYEDYKAEAAKSSRQ